MATASTDSRRTSGPITLYSVLDIPTDSDPETIRNAYRRLARLFHPDTGGDAHSMSLVNKAWAVLGDPGRRAAYDRRMGIEPVVKVSAGPPEPVEGSPLTSRMMEGTGTVLDFGRYEGWTIDQLAKHDPDYLLWLERTPLGRPLQAEIQATLGDRHDDSV